MRFNYSTNVCIRSEVYQETFRDRVRVSAGWRGWSWRWQYKVGYRSIDRCLEYETELSGAGFDLGSTPASIEWEKVNINLKWKPIKTIHVKTQSLVVVPVGTDGTSWHEKYILSRVSDNDCVEVFFVKGFSPSDGHGGGAGIWNPGTASAKAIIADSHITCNQSTFLANAVGSTNRKIRVCIECGFLSRLVTCWD